MSLNQDRIARVKRTAHENDRHSGCSQGVSLALQDKFNIGNAEALKAATVISGGVARHGETCGLVVGREKMEDTQTYRHSMEPSADIIKRYKEG